MFVFSIYTKREDGLKCFDKDPVGKSSLKRTPFNDLKNVVDFCTFSSILPFPLL